MKVFNINNRVKVKLTDLGVKIYKDYYKTYNIHTKGPYMDDEGYTSFQMWDLMEVYGPHISIDSEMVFEPNVLLSDKNLKSLEGQEEVKESIK